VLEGSNVRPPNAMIDVAMVHFNGAYKQLNIAQGRVVGHFPIMFRDGRCRDIR